MRALAKNIIWPGFILFLFLVVAYVLTSFALGFQALGWENQKEATENALYGSIIATIMVTPVAAPVALAASFARHRSKRASTTVLTAGVLTCILCLTLISLFAVQNAPIFSETTQVTVINMAIVYAWFRLLKRP